MDWCPKKGECTVCFDPIQSTEEHRHVRNQCICEECARTSIVPILLDALKFEHCDPPKMGIYTINYRVFKDLLPADYEFRYHSLFYERRTPQLERIYCQHTILSEGEVCGKFLGSLQEPIRDETGSFPLRFCTRCKYYTCAVCNANRYNVSRRHDCPGPLTKEEKLRRKYHVIESETTRRGRDFQYCANPDCLQVMYLGDGCNHITCPTCHWAYCYICGTGWAPSTINYMKHWGEEYDPCPRYNQQKPIPQQAQEMVFATSLVPREVRSVWRGINVRSKICRFVESSTEHSDAVRATSEVLGRFRALKGGYVQLPACSEDEASNMKEVIGLLRIVVLLAAFKSGVDRVKQRAVLRMYYDMAQVKLDANWKRTGEDFEYPDCKLGQDFGAVMRQGKRCLKELEEELASPPRFTTTSADATPGPRHGA